MGLTIDIRDLATPMLTGMKRTLGNKRALNRAAAEGALPVVQKNMLEKSGSERNAFGARSTFWNRMLAGTKAAGDENSGSIRMPREIALRYHGGTVKPKQSKLLALPARTESYGTSPRQFNDLRFIPTGRGGLLVRNEQTQLVRYRSGHRKGEVKERREIGGEVMFFLVPEVTIKPDPSVLPSPAALRVGAARGVRAFVQLQTRRSAT